MNINTALLLVALAIAGAATRMIGTIRYVDVHSTNPTPPYIGWSRRPQCSKQVLKKVTALSENYRNSACRHLWNVHGSGTHRSAG